MQEIKESIDDKIIYDVIKKQEYYSPFDKLEESHPSEGVCEEETRFSCRYCQSQFQQFKGTLEQIMRELCSVDPLLQREGDIANLALHPPRIIRAVVDYVAERSCSSPVELVEESVKFAINAYTNPKDVSELTKRLNNILSAQYPKLFDTMVYQTEDRITWIATAPQLSRLTAMDLKNTFNGEPVLFIALAHGSIAAGLDTFIRYQSMGQDKDSLFYPIRFSRAKHCDDVPYVSSEEEKYLKKCSEDRRVVIFDEDVSTGTTLRKAYAFFSDFLKGITLSTNYNSLRVSKNVFKIDELP